MTSRFWTLALLSVLSLAFAGCNEAPAPTGSAHADHPTTSPATTGGYPLTTCVVSGEPLGSMGDPVIYKHNGRDVKFCCSNCEAEFKKDPARYIGILDTAIKTGAKPATQPAPHAH